MAEITKREIFEVMTDFYGKMIEPEFKALHKRLDEHDQKFRDIFDHFDRIDTKIDRLETEYYGIVAGLDRLEKRIDSVEKRLNRVEERLNGVETRLDGVENRLNHIEIGQKEMHEKLDKEISIRETLERELKDLKHRVSILQGRIEDLEKRLKSFS